MDLSQFGINANNAGQTGLQIPGLSNLQGTLNTIMIGVSVLSGLFMLLYIVSLVQRFRADRAMIGMHKDIAAIRALLEQRSGASPAASPAQPNVVTRDGPESVSST